MTFTSTSIESRQTAPNSGLDTDASKKSPRHWPWILLTLASWSMMAWWFAPVFRTLPVLLFGCVSHDEGKCLSDLRSIETGLLRYRVSNGHNPSEEEGLSALVLPPPTARVQRALYVKEWLIDPWNHPYQYQVVNTTSRGYDLFSLGPDGKEGTEDDIHLP